MKPYQIALCALVVTSLALVAGAETPPAAVAPVDIRALLPYLLPGDQIPNPSLPPPAKAAPPAQRRGAGEERAPVPGPSLALAIEAAQAAIAACAKDGLKVGAAVIDSSGQPRALLLGEGAPGFHVYTGARKALAALAFGTPSSAIAGRLQTDPSASALLKPNMRAQTGAVPLMSGSTVIGAIGVSGASAEQDESCAAAGAAHVHDRS